MIIFVAGVEVVRRRAVQTDIAVAARAGDESRLPKDAVGHIGDVNVLKRLDAAFLKQVLVDGDGADIMQVGLGDGGAVYFCHTDAYKHIFIVDTNDRLAIIQEIVAVGCTFSRAAGVLNSVVS